MGTAPSPRNSAKTSLDDVVEALKDVLDPEIGVNIVDLGLVYGIQISEDNAAIIDLTLTSAACPLSGLLEAQIHQVLSSAYTGGGGLVDSVRLNWVWTPPWGPSRITEEGREQLRALGFHV